jgi:uncharacterized protein YxjI
MPNKHGIYTQGVGKMKLYIRQKVFSWTDSFKVLDENGNQRYYVKGEFFSLGKRLHVFDEYDRSFAHIQQKLFTLLPQYSVYVGGDEVARVIREFSFIHPRYSIERFGETWTVEGRFWEHDYEILCGGRAIASIHKEWMTWGDSYEIDIDQDEHEIEVLMIALIIDCVMDATRNG